MITTFTQLTFATHQKYQEPGFQVLGNEKKIKTKKNSIYLTSTSEWFFELCANENCANSEQWRWNKNENRRAKKKQKNLVANCSSRTKFVLNMNNKREKHQQWQMIFWWSCSNFCCTLFIRCIVTDVAIDFFFLIYNRRHSRRTCLHFPHFNVKIVKMYNRFLC